MTKANAQIYGPPAHNLDYVNITLIRLEHEWLISNLSGGSRTSKGPLWRLTDVYESDEPDHAHEQVAIALHALVSDVIRDQPNTQARAQFVASGGLYEQLHMF